MPTYYTDITKDEDGFGLHTVRVVVSDTYTGLTAAGTEVVVLDARTARQDLDIDTGVFSEDEADMQLLEWASENADDQAAIDFVLAAQDAAQPRYLGIIHNPSATPTADEFEFRGVIRTEMDWVDVEWGADEWVPPTVFLREWEISAGSYDVTAILRQALWSDPDEGTTGLVDGINPATLGVRDAPGYFYTTGGSYGHREVRFGDLVSLQDLIQALIDEASPAGVTMTYEPQQTGWKVSVAEIIPIYRTDVDRNLRWARIYNANAVESGGTVAPFRLPGLSTPIDLYSGKSPGDTYEIEVDWKLLKGHTDEEEPFSWKRFKTLDELIYSIAATLDSFVQFEYVSATDIRIRLVPRIDVDGEQIVLRSAIEAGGNVAQTGGNASERQAFAAASGRFARDGYAGYQYDAGYLQKKEGSRPKVDGELLPLSIAPTWVDFAEDPGDIEEVDVQPRWHQVMLPTNAIWYNGPTTLHPKAAEDPPDPRVNTRAMHTGMYLRFTAGANHGGLGIDGRVCSLPIRAFWAPGEGVEFEQSERIAQYLNKVRGRDSAYFKKELNLVVPGMNGFLKNATASWTHCKLGNTFDYDGLTWTITGIERDYDGWQTRVRAYESSRYSLTGAVLTDDHVGEDAEDIRRRGAQYTGRRPQVAINRFQVVSLIKGNEFVEPSEASEAHYRRVFGIAIEDGDPEVDAYVIVQLYGRVEGAALELFPSADNGTPVFLRSGTVNLSLAPLTGASGGEDMYQQIGVIDGNDIILDLKEPRIYR